MPAKLIINAIIFIVLFPAHQIIRSEIVDGYLPCFVTSAIISVNTAQCNAENSIKPANPVSITLEKRLNSVIFFRPAADPTRYPNTIQLKPTEVIQMPNTTKYQWI